MGGCACVQACVQACVRALMFCSCRCYYFFLQALHGATSIPLLLLFKLSLPMLFLSLPLYIPLIFAWWLTPFTCLPLFCLRRRRFFIALLLSRCCGGCYCCACSWYDCTTAATAPSAAAFAAICGLHFPGHLRPFRLCGRRCSSVSAAATYAFAAAAAAMTYAFAATAAAAAAMAYAFAAGAAAASSQQASKRIWSGSEEQRHWRYYGEGAWWPKARGTR